MILYAWNLVPFFDAGKNELIYKIYQLHYIWKPWCYFKKGREKSSKFRIDRLFFFGPLCEKLKESQLTFRFLKKNA